MFLAPGAVLLGFLIPITSLVVLVLVVVAIFQIRDNTRQTAHRLAEILRRMDEMNGAGRDGS